MDHQLIYVALTIIANVWGAAWLVIHKFERERVAFVGEKADFHAEQATFIAARAAHAASKSHGRADTCSVCHKVVNKYDTLDDGRVICHDCLAKVAK